jgi:hypothetical protein
MLVLKTSSPPDSPGPVKLLHGNIVPSSRARTAFIKAPFEVI